MDSQFWSNFQLTLTDFKEHIFFSIHFVLIGKMDLKGLFEKSKPLISLSQNGSKITARKTH